MTMNVSSAFGPGSWASVQGPYKPSDGFDTEKHLSFQDVNIKYIVAFFAGLFALRFLFESYHKASLNIPIFTPRKSGWTTTRGHFLRNGMNAFYDGSRKFQQNVFRLTTTDSYKKVIIPPKFLAEMGKKPDDIIDIEATLRSFMEYDYTGIPSDNFLHRAPRLIKGNLTTNLGQITPTISEESAAVIALELGSPSEWTPQVMHRKLLRITAQVSGRIFVGPEMNRDEEYIEMAMNYATICMRATRAVKAVHPMLRPFKAPFLPEIKALKARKAQFTAHLMPIIQQRKEAVFGKDDRPQDLLQAVVDELGSHGLTDDDIVDVQQILTLAAIHTTTHITTNVFYFLAAYAQYIPALREEIKENLAKHDGQYSFRMLQDLKKLDSFIKESARMEVTSAISFDRMAASTFDLSDGTRIPAGTFMATSTLDLTRDPELYPDPNTFHPFRFAEAREADPSSAIRNQFVSVQPNMLTFGLGRHACPGRFFAAAIMKVIIAQIIMRYDVKMPDGIEGRYKSLKFASTSNPDPTKEIMFKEVEDSQI